MDVAHPQPQPGRGTTGGIVEEQHGSKDGEVRIDLVPRGSGTEISGFLPSGKLTINYGKLPCLMDKSTI